MARLSLSLLKKEKNTKSKPPAETKNKTPAGPVLSDASSKPSKSLKRKKEDEPLLEADHPSPKIPRKSKQDESKPSMARKSSKGTIEEKSAIVNEGIKVEQEKKKVPKQKKRTEPTTDRASETVRTKTKSKPTQRLPAESDPTVEPPEKKSKLSKRSEPSIPALTSISRPRKHETSKAEKAKAPSPEPFSGVEDDEASEAGEGSDEEDEGEGLLHGFSTDEDSSDEDGTDDEASPLDIGKLPTVAKDDVSVKRKLERAQRQPTEDRGVLYLGRLPHGFFEDQMKAYFSQFGNVTRLRLSRNKKSGKSKHYGFIEFDSSSVAQIVADTMDNYLIMGHILRCKVVPKDQVHPELWVGANRKWRVVPSDRLARTQHNKPRTEDQQRQAARRLLKRQGERKRKLAALGIKYDFDAVSYKRPKKAE